MIVVTGGAGFIGSNLVKRLNRDGACDILIVDNLKNADKYRNLVGARFADYLPKSDFIDRVGAGRFDAPVESIFHEGACTDTLEYDGDYMIRNNFEYSKTLLHFALDRTIPFVYASSAAVYGHANLATETEENEWPLNIYGYSKLAFDRYARRFFATARSTVVGLRYFNVYGNGEAHKGRMASMVYQFYRQVRETGVAKLFGAVGQYGPGESTRDFVSVEDLVEINMFCLRRDPVQAVVNAGTGVSRTWNALARAVIHEVGEGRIETIDFPPGLLDKYQFNTRADVTQLRSLGYEREFLGLEEGVHRYLSTIDAETQAFRPRIAA